MPAAASTLATQSKLVPLAPVERDTVNKIFFGAIDRFDRPKAMLYKAGEAWQPVSHREVEERATALAAFLAEHGVGPGDRVAILSENRPEWAISDYASLAMGAVDVPLYPTLPPNQVAYILADCGAKAVLVSTADQLAKIDEIRASLPDLKLVVVFDDVRTEGAHRFSDALEEGRRAVADGRFTGLRERALAVSRDEVATLIYTSGTTGNPKGVMLTHWNLASNVAGAIQHGLDGIIRPGDTTLSFLPLSHVFERMVDYLYFDMGCTVAYAESMDKVADNMLEVRPNVAVSVPRLFEKIYSRVTSATGAKKVLVDWARRVGGAYTDAVLAGKAPSLPVRLQYRLADRIVFSKLRERTGGNFRAFVSGGAPLSAGIARFFFAAGLPVYEGYGLTETSPVIAVNKPGKVRLGTVGNVIPGVEAAIAHDSGEILTRGPHVMKGYWKNPDATAEVIDDDGWLHTGDIGEIDGDGFVKITDRLKNLLVTAGGKNIAPQPMENLAVLSPYVAQVVMIGDRRAFPSMLVVPDFETLVPWAAAQGIATADRAALARDERVRALLEREVLGRLEEFARYERPKKVMVLAEEFTIDAGTLTPTLKVKRKVVEKKYADEIEQLYAGHAADG
jgi:long-chain acyl-CoA synthetase